MKTYGKDQKRRNSKPKGQGRKIKRISFVYDGDESKNERIIRSLIMDYLNARKW